MCAPFPFYFESQLEWLRFVEWGRAREGQVPREQGQVELKGRLKAY